jgi:hypothetical protein
VPHTLQYISLVFGLPYICSIGYISVDACYFRIISYIFIIFIIRHCLYCDCAKYMRVVVISGSEYLEIIGFWILSIVQYSKNSKK